MSLLDVVVDGYYQKTDIIVGSKEEVERVQRYVISEKKKKKQEETGEDSKESGTGKTYRIPENKPNEEAE